MAKHKNPFTNTKGNHAAIPHHGGPVTGNGHNSTRKGAVKGVVFRQADGKVALPPKAGKASRLPKFLGGKG